MAWCLCACGWLKEVTPQYGDTITSVIHLQRPARWDGTAAVARMEEIPAVRMRPAEAPSAVTPQLSTACRRLKDRSPNIFSTGHAVPILRI
jgi:hypothetical protein